MGVSRAWRMRIIEQTTKKYLYEIGLEQFYTFFLFFFVAVRAVGVIFLNFSRHTHTHTFTRIETHNLHGKFIIANNLYVKNFIFLLFFLLCRKIRQHRETSCGWNYDWSLLYWIVLTALIEKGITSFIDNPHYLLISLQIVWCFNSLFFHPSFTSILQ